MPHHRLASRKGALRLAALGSAAALTITLLPGQAASARSAPACDTRSNNTYQKLLLCVTLEGVREHQQALQKIADNSTDPVYPGTRAAGTDGYADSVDYVAGLLEDAGYEVTLDPVEITFNFPATLRQLTPVEAEYETGVFTGSGSGVVEGNVIPIDISLEKGELAVSTSGCEAADFAGIDWSGPNDIALVQRGTCFFGTKAYYAEQAGAEAVIIFNQGNTPEREELVRRGRDQRRPADPGGTRTRSRTASRWWAQASPTGSPCPQPGSTAFVEVLPAETRTDYNVIAELPGKNEDNVVMAGAHLDSVIEGPGINDNGSGSAALLETALLMANLNPENTLRFGWWAGEEQGLVGSTDYVEGLSQAERDRIALYMNYDMVGSPNYIFMVYDADESTFPAPEDVTIPAGFRGDRGRLRVVLHRGSASRTRTPCSRVAATIRPSSTTASPPVASSPVRRRSRPRSRRRSGAAPPASSSTPATTRPATRSRTSTCTRSRSTAT